MTSERPTLGCTSSRVSVRPVGLPTVLSNACPMNCLRERLVHMQTSVRSCNTCLYLYTARFLRCLTGQTTKRPRRLQRQQWWNYQIYVSLYITLILVTYTQAGMGGMVKAVHNTCLVESRGAPGVSPGRCQNISLLCSHALLSCQQHGTNNARNHQHDRGVEARRATQYRVVDGPGCSAYGCAWHSIQVASGLGLELIYILNSLEGSLLQQVA